MKTQDQILENETVISVENHEEMNDAPHTLVCPYCRAKNPVDAEKCNCGYYFDEEAYEASQSNEEEAEKEAAEEANPSADMFWGAVWCIGGLAVTYYTYSNASPGESYIVAWGAVIFGAYQFLKGLFNAVS